jgi:hypothetical protein
MYDRLMKEIDMLMQSASQLMQLQGQKANSTASGKSFPAALTLTVQMFRTNGSQKRRN